VETITVRVPTHIKEGLGQLAKDDSRGVSNYLCMILTKHVVDQNKIKRTKK